MDRIFEFDNKNEIKLSVEGFDVAPILIGTEQSNGVVSLENLSNFQECTISVKSVNIKDENNDVTELKTYYTVVKAKDKKYNNEIIDNLERKENSKLMVEVCIGIGEYKRYIILDYPSTENLVNITKDLPSKIAKMFTIKDKTQSDSDEALKNIISITLYDKSGFEMAKTVTISEITEHILSVRIINTTDDSVKEVVSKKAQDVFKMIKENGKNNVEIISDFTSSVMKMMSLKRI